MRSTRTESPHGKQSGSQLIIKIELDFTSRQCYLRIITHAENLMNENSIPVFDSGSSHGTSEGGNSFKISPFPWFLGLLTAFLILIGMTSRSFGTTSYVDLGTANNFTVLVAGTNAGGSLALNRLNDTSNRAFNTNPAITGNVGIGSGVSLYPTGHPATTMTLTGNWVYSDSTGQTSTYVNASGTSQNAALVHQAAQDVKTFSSTVAGFAATKTLTLSSPGTSITDAGYVTDPVQGVKISVVTFTGTGLLSLTNFTINGAANDVFYINFLTNQSLQLSGSITLAGGVLAQNVYWNFTTSADKWNLLAGSSLSGRIVAPLSSGSSGNATGAQVIGGIYGEDVDLRGGTVLGVPTTQVVPEAGSLTAGGIFCGLLLGSSLLSKVRRKKTQPVP